MQNIKYLVSDSMVNLFPVSSVSRVDFDIMVDL